MTRVLLVDDYPAARRFLREILQGDDIEFVEAGNGREAIEAFTLHHPDWVVMDVEMPEMDGLETTRTICSTNPEARVIVISQYQDPAFRPAALSVGAYAFLQKDDLLTLPGILGQPSNPG